MKSTIKSTIKALIFAVFLTLAAVKPSNSYKFVAHKGEEGVRCYFTCPQNCGCDYDDENRCYFVNWCIIHFGPTKFGQTR
jgi:hypothetical protein